jgi:UDP-glucose-4-epimerase GalE
LIDQRGTETIMTELAGTPILVSGGAGYIGSHVVHSLKQAGFAPIVLDSLINGHAWATVSASAFRQGDIANVDLVRELCREFKPVAAMHFAAFIEVGESVGNPAKYLENNRDKASVFFDTLANEGVDKIVFSSTAAVYGETLGNEPITEEQPTRPINPYGQSKLEAEQLLQGIASVRSVILRYFNVAGAATDVAIGEAHFPETHLLPRIILPLIGAPADIQQALGLGQGFKIFGDDHATRDGTAIRDYLHVLDLADAHISALKYLLNDGASSKFNLGSGSGYSVKEIVDATRQTLGRPEFAPAVAPRRDGDPATLVASSIKAMKVLGWRARRDIADMIKSAAHWHKTEQYQSSIRAKADLL